MPEVERESQSTVRIDPEVFREKREEIVIGAGTITAATAAEAGAAASYYRGQADVYNGFLEAAKERNPEAVKDLPAPLQVDEIQVRHIQQERDQSEERSLSLSR